MSISHQQSSVSSGTANPCNANLGSIGIPHHIWKNDPKGSLLYSAARSVEFKEWEEPTQVFFEWLANDIHMKSKLTKDRGERRMYEAVLNILSTNNRMKVVYDQMTMTWICQVNPEVLKEQKHHNVSNTRTTM